MWLRLQGVSTPSQLHRFGCFPFKIMFKSMPAGGEGVGGGRRRRGGGYKVGGGFETPPHLLLAHRIVRSCRTELAHADQTSVTFSVFLASEEQVHLRPAGKLRLSSLIFSASSQISFGRLRRVPARSLTHGHAERNHVSLEESASF